MTLRFHLVSLPHTQTTLDYSACAFTEKVRKFAIMMMDRGHEVFLYSGEFNEAPCTEHICCITEEERQRHVGEKSYIEASFDPRTEGWQTTTQNGWHILKFEFNPFRTI